MYIRTFAAAALLSLGALSAQADTGQIAAGLGLSPEEAASLSLTEIAVMKRNAETGGDDRWGLPRQGDAGAAARVQLGYAAGVTPAAAARMSLSELAAAKIYREARGDDKVAPVASRGPVSADDQFAASAGLKPEIARARSFHEVYLAKIARQSSDD